MDRAGLQLLPIWEAETTLQSPPARRVPTRCEVQARRREVPRLPRTRIECIQDFANSSLLTAVQSRCSSFQRIRRATRWLQVHEHTHARSDPAFVAAREFVRHEARRRSGTDARSNAVPAAERVGVSTLGLGHREHLHAVFMRVEIVRRLLRELQSSEIGVSVVQHERALDQSGAGGLREHA
jgi:hypothetical protein